MMEAKTRVRQEGTSLVAYPWSGLVLTEAYREDAAVAWSVGGGAD